MSGGGMSPNRTVAVVICAYTMDRWDDVVAAYTSVLAQTEPADEVVVVIDHNDELLAALRAEFPLAKIIPNTGTRGLSGARNVAAAATTSDVLLYLDDDARAEPEWLARLHSAFVGPDVHGVAGHAEAAWPTGGRPRWFPDEFLWVVGCSYRGLPTTRTAIRNPIGSSMGFTRAALDVTGGFKTDLGRVGTHPVGAEETELAIRLRQAVPSARIMLVPDAVVHHRVSGDRLAFRYFARRCFWEGVSKALISENVGSGDALEAERSYVAKVLPRAVARGVRDAVRGDLSGLGRSGAVIAGLLLTALGYLRGTVNRLRTRRRRGPGA